MKKLVRESLDEEPYVDYEEPDVDKYGTIYWRNEDGELHREDGPAVEFANGSKFWYLNNKSHREDGPAIERANGTKAWWINDKLHREDGPAIERANGTKSWYLNGELQPDYFGKKPVRESLDEEPYVDYEEPEVDKYGTIRWRNEDGELHREDGPAVEHADGSKSWYINGELHREDGPAVEYASGSKHWYINNKRHREDGPAIIWASGTKSWWINDKRHREDGPAVEHADGFKDWWLNDKRQPDYFGKKPVRESLDEEPYYIEYEEHEPEIDNEGTKYWYNEDGELHQEDGPAVEFTDGYKEWWINGQRQPDYFGKE